MLPPRWGSSTPVYIHLERRKSSSEFDRERESKQAFNREREKYKRTQSGEHIVGYTREEQQQRNTRINWQTWRRVSFGNL
jgi:FAD/FMN-containing dehydrogenase